MFKIHPFENPDKPMFSLLTDFTKFPELMQITRSDNRVKLPAVTKILKETMPTGKLLFY